MVRGSECHRRDYAPPGKAEVPLGTAVAGTPIAPRSMPVSSRPSEAWRIQGIGRPPMPPRGDRPGPMEALLGMPTTKL